LTQKRARKKRQPEKRGEKAGPEKEGFLWGQRRIALPRGNGYPMDQRKIEKSGEKCTDNRYRSGKKYRNLWEMGVAPEKHSIEVSGRPPTKEKSLTGNKKGTIGRDQGEKICTDP